MPRRWYSKPYIKIFNSLFNSLIVLKKIRLLSDTLGIHR